MLAAGAAPELAAVDSAWDAAVAARDEAAFLSRVAEDSVFAGGSLQVGRAAIREKWSRYFTPGGPTLRWKPTGSGMAASGDLGWTVGEASFAWQEKGVAPSPGRYVTVWAKDSGGRWVAVLDASLEPSGEAAARPVRAHGHLPRRDARGRHRHLGARPGRRARNRHLPGGPRHNREYLAFAKTPQFELVHAGSPRSAG